MAKEIQRRRKLIQLIKDLTLVEITNTTKKKTIPTIVGDYILEQYGLGDQTHSENTSDEEINEFIPMLESFIAERYETSKVRLDQIPGSYPESQNNFVKACESFTNVKNEYLRVSLQLLSTLNDINQFRDKYFNHLKEKSLIKHDELEVLVKKLHFLKLQSFLKFYTENNAFDAHLRLREILTGKLKGLKSKYRSLVDLDAKYSELKTNKTYCDLFQTYKQLLKKEKKIDYMMEK